MKLVYSKLKKSIIFTVISGGLLQLLPSSSVEARPIYNNSTQNNILSQNSIIESQSIQGLWVGTFTQNHEPRMWNIRMTLSQKGQIIEGTSYHEPITNQPVSVVYELKGILANNTFEFIEGKMLERNAPSNWNFCNLSGKLDLVSSDKYKILQGYWECFTEGRRSFGKITLTKQ